MIMRTIIIYNNNMPGSVIKVICHLIELRQFAPSGAGGSGDEPATVH